jgi:hypothetical protein
MKSWPSLGVHYGITALGVWIAIAIGFIIELIYLKKLLPKESFTRVFGVSLGMNIASAASGMAFIALMDVSGYFLGIPWLWHLVIIYVMTALINVSIEGLVVLDFFPSINKKRLLYLLVLANAFSVAIGLLVVKLL